MMVDRRQRSKDTRGVSAQSCQKKTGEIYRKTGRDEFFVFFFEGNRLSKLRLV